MCVVLSMDSSPAVTEMGAEVGGAFLLRTAVVVLVDKTSTSTSGIWRGKGVSSQQSV